MATSGEHIDDFVVGINVDLDDTALGKAINKIKDFKDNIKTLATGAGFGFLLQQINKATKGIMDATRATGDWATELERTAKRTGVSSDVLQRLNIIEKENNMAEGTLSSILEDIKQKQISADYGQYDEGYLRAGISLRGGTPAEILENIIGQGIAGGPERQRRLAQLLGVDQSIFELGEADIRKIGKEEVLSDDEKKKFIELNKEFGKFDVKWDALKKKLQILVMPLVEKILEFANKHMKKLLDYIDDLLNDEEAMNKIKGFLENSVTILLTIVSICLPPIISAITLIGKLLLAGAVSPLLKIIGLIWKISKFSFFTGIIGTFGDVLFQTSEKMTLLQKSARICGLVLHGLFSIVLKLTWGIIKLGWSLLTNPLTWYAALLGGLLVIITDIINVSTGGEAKIFRWLERITEKIKWLHDIIKTMRIGIEGLFGDEKMQKKLEAEVTTDTVLKGVGIDETSTKGKFIKDIVMGLVNSSSEEKKDTVKAKDAVQGGVFQGGVPYAPKETTKQDSAFAQAMLKQQTLFPNMPKSYNKTQENKYDFYNYNTININGEDAEENAKQVGRFMQGQFPKYIKQTEIGKAGNLFGNTENF